MSDEDDFVDLTLDDDDESDDDDTNGIPYKAFLPIGVDVTDDVVHIDSDDSDNDVHLAQRDVEAHWRERTQQKQLPQKQGKFLHSKALRAAARKRKRQQAAALAEQKRQQALQEEERKRAAELAEQQRLEKQRLEKKRQKEQLERKRKAEAEALRKNPPQVNFIIIDSDPEEDLTTRRRRTATTRPHVAPPPRKRRASSSDSDTRRFVPRKLPRSRGDKPQSASTARTASSQSAEKEAAASTLKDTVPSTTGGRKPQPYQYLGSRRLEFLRPSSTFRMERDFNYFRTREDAAAEQDRLLRESAERMRQQHHGRPPPVQPPPPRLPPNLVYGYGDMGGPIFTQIIYNIHERFPLHWQWKNPFSCLGLPQNAPAAAAKQSYRRLVRLYHPDKSHAETSSKFHAVVLAYKKIRRQLNGEEI